MHLQDTNLDGSHSYKIVYTGSLRKANEQICALLDIIELMQSDAYRNCKFLIYGKGELENFLKQICLKNG